MCVKHKSEEILLSFLLPCVVSGCPNLPKFQHQQKGISWVSWWCWDVLVSQPCRTLVACAEHVLWLSAWWVWWASPSAGVCQCGGLRPLLGGSCSGTPTSPVSCLDRLFVSAQIAGSVTESWGPSRLTESVSLFANVVRRGLFTFYPLG